MNKYDVVVIGGGPAGLAASKSANDNGAKTLLIEREGRLGGILKQCIHDGFGLQRFKERLTGPEYAWKEIVSLPQEIDVKLLTFVSKIFRKNEGFELVLITREGILHVETKNVILATGCRERTSKQIAIHGTNPAGVITAGTAQNYINILGEMPTKKCVILGSGDIGLIMARRITLEGGKVLGVYEAKNSPSGLTRNIVQCLNDFNIPLYLNHTVTRVFGIDRLTAVEICKVDDQMRIIAGTSQVIECDSLILSVGLIPENEVASSLGVEINPKTKGPYCDQSLMTSVGGVYSCGNSLHVNDLVDYVSESGEIAGKNAAVRKNDIKRELIDVSPDNNIMYVVPSRIDLNSDLEKIILYFRSSGVFENKRLVIKSGERIIYTKKYSALRPPEMERVVINLGNESNIEGIEIGLEDYL